MAGRGAPPKPVAHRRDGAAQRATVAADGQKRGPDLPPGVEWPSQTRDWWHNWQHSAQAVTFGATDWDFLLDTALLHAAFWNGDPGVAGELRLRVAKFGATPEDRLRLQIDVDPSAAAEPVQAPPARRKVDPRRKRALKVIEGDGA